jgi:parvulin-like peptidyl-prolyl isomerase
MRKSLIIYMSLLLAAVSMPVISQAETAVPAVVAIVNGVSLTELELNQEINALMPFNQTFHGKLSDEKMNKVRSEALKNLVDSELRAQDAQLKGITVSQQLEEEINRQIVKFQTKEGLVAAYTGTGFTENSFMRIFERKLLAEKVKQSEVDAKVTITPEKVKNYYMVNEAKYSKPEEFRARHILLKVDPSSTQEERAKIRARAENILKKIKKGANFEELARNESDDLTKIKGGDLGYFHSGQTVEEFEVALKKLKVGNVSNVVESIYGYHIIQLTERRAPRQIPFEEIKDKISKDLVDSEKKVLLSRWMEDLYKKAGITYPGVK